LTKWDLEPADLDEILASFEATRASRRYIREEWDDFGTFDSLIRQLRVIATRQQRASDRSVIIEAADRLRMIAKDGYRPPRPSTRHRRGSRLHVNHLRAILKDRTVDEFLILMNQEFSMSEATVKKYFIKPPKPFFEKTRQDQIDPANPFYVFVQERGMTSLAR
jgi:hypothetical protein